MNTIWLAYSPFSSGVTSGQSQMLARVRLAGVKATYLPNRTAAGWRLVAFAW